MSFDLKFSAANSPYAAIYVERSSIFRMYSDVLIQQNAFGFLIKY